jgi:hypothetical protein
VLLVVLILGKGNARPRGAEQVGFYVVDRHVILEARAQEKKQGAVGLPENDVERLPKSGLIGRG